MDNTRHPMNSWIAIVSDNILFACSAKRRVIQKNNVESSNGKNTTTKQKLQIIKVRFLISLRSIHIILVIVNVLSLTMYWDPMIYYVVGIIHNCVEKRGGTTGVLNQKASGDGVEREPVTRDRRYTGTRPFDTETRIDADTERRKRTNLYINK